jgi:GGDEF domain-containing protein
MPISEIAIWSAMSGGIFAVLLLAVVDAISNWSKGALRNLLFVLLTGASVVVMTGLPEVFFPDLSPRLLVVLKSSLGPLAGAMAIYFLGGWLGGLREDALVHRLTTWGGSALFLMGLALALYASQMPIGGLHSLLWLVAGVTMIPVAIAIAVVSRSAALGDPLARWMSPAIACLALMVPGLYMRGLNLPGPGTGTWLLTALVTVTYFLIASVLVVLRTRQRKRLARLLRLELGADPATDLPTGSALLSLIEQDFWRTARMRGQTTVICLYLSNLYELAKSPIQGIEQQILANMSARIRRAAGFRCTVGLYHPRCFVVVLSTDRHNAHANQTVDDLRALVAQPLAVVGEWQASHTFKPRVGMGLLTINPARAKPIDVLNQAEQKAILAARRSATVPQVDVATTPAALMEWPVHGEKSQRSTGHSGSASTF